MDDMGISGPPPKDADQRARRNPTVAMTKLPAAGRQGPAPKWPLPADVTLAAQLRVAREKEKAAKLAAEDPDITARERAVRDRSHAAAREKVAILSARARAAKKRETDIWAELWATPMAVAWERLRWVREVALYVRFQALAELGDQKAAQEARLRAESLGLTPTSMQKLRWSVADETPAGKAATGGVKSGARARYGHLQVAPDLGPTTNTG